MMFELRIKRLHHNTSFHMSESGFRLSLKVEDYGEVMKEDILEKLPLEIDLFYGKGKKPKKATFDIPVTIETFEPEKKMIEEEIFESTQSWFDFFAGFRGANTKFLLFAKGHQDIGSGFVSNEIHFASFLLRGIREFLYVTVNRDIFNRLTQGKILIPESLAEVMEHSQVGVNTVENLFANAIQERENHIVELNDSSQNLETVHFDQIPPQIEQLSKITVWKRYEILLFSLNNLFFAIDEHFESLSRTLPLDPDVVKEIFKEILNRHKIISELDEEDSNGNE